MRNPFIFTDMPGYSNPNLKETEKIIRENFEKNEQVRLATLHTADNTRQTIEEVSRLNLQVSELSIDLENERTRIKKLEKENAISEYSGKISTLFWSLLGFIVTISIFYLENDNISNKVSIVLLLSLIFIHIGAIIYNVVKMQQARKSSNNL